MKGKIKKIYPVLVFVGLLIPLFSFAQTFEKDLFFGLSNDPGVAKLQEFLTIEGIYSGPITGNFFSLTLEGVKKLQFREGISPAAGYFGSITRARANEILSSQIQASNQQIAQETGRVLSPSPAPQLDVISSLQNQVLILQQQIAFLLEQFKSQQTSANSSNSSSSLAPNPTPGPTYIPAITPTSAPVPTIIPPEISATTAIVDYVIDGDTISIYDISGVPPAIELGNRERVRLIGIDTPERGTTGYIEARNKLSGLTLNKSVILVKDVSERDRYGRLLRYLYVGNLFVNLEMVKQGYASAYTYPPDVKYSASFLAAEREARSKKVGLWVPAQPQPSQSSPVSPVSFTVPGCAQTDCDCADFSTHAYAQWFYENYDPSNKHRLDGDKDGSACESLP